MTNANSNHKHRVMLVQEVLYQFIRGGLSESTALALLEDAGVSNGGANALVDRHRPKRTTFNAPSLWPRPPEPPRAA